MKLWITRPSVSSVYMGGLRNFTLWNEQPVYDLRCVEEWVAIRDKKIAYTVCREFGWYGSLPRSSCAAKKFLKQDEEVMDKVWSLAMKSVQLKDSKEDLRLGDMDFLLKTGIEGQVKCSVKKFLLELDLKTNMVTQISPFYVTECDPSRVRFEVGEVESSSNYFVDGDKTRPWFRAEDDVTLENYF